MLLCGIGGVVGLKIVQEKLEPYKEQAATHDISEIDNVEIQSLILDRKGRIIGRMFVENRDKVPIEKVPQKLIDALIAQEDQRFFEHDGVDRIGVARAVWLNLKAGEVTQGASTITMQLARNAFNLQSEAAARGQRGFERKIVEAFLALRIEEYLMAGIAGEYPDEAERKAKMKRMVLEYYLNRIPFGNAYYGVRSAALGYFGKEPMALSIEECASLVACVKNPKQISPLADKAKNRKARDHVLNRMLDEGMITESEWMTLTTKPVVVNPKPLRKGKSQFYEIVDDIALEKVGDEAMSRGGFRIYTTIDRDMQERAERSLLEQLDRIEAESGYGHSKHGDFVAAPGKVPAYLQGAALMIDSDTGNVLAYVGGRDYAHSQYDFIQLGRRPLGTAYLPMVYAASLESGRHPCTTVEDEAMDARAVMVGGQEGILGEWGMEILNPQYEGRITSKRALSSSKLAATVRLGRELGLEEVADRARKFGLSVGEGELLNRMLVGYDSVSLTETVRAYAAISRKGKLPGELRFIERIENAEGEVVYEASAAEVAEGVEQACDEITAYQIHDMLRESLTTGNLVEEAATLRQQPFLGAVKTGTTHSFADGWCVGYNGKVALGVWVGFHQGTEAIYPNAFGRKVAFRPWSEVMNVAEGSYAAVEVEPPATLTPSRVCSHSGLLATRYCYEPVDDPVKGKSYRYTGHTELLRANRSKLGLCDTHGKGGIGTNEVLERYGPLKESNEQQHLAVAPIRPENSGLTGKDPYGAELVTLNAGTEGISVFVRGPSLLLDTEVLGDSDSGVLLHRPRKIEIKTD